jgi:RNA polymerase sigma factor (sigma-70 family)
VTKDQTPNSGGAEEVERRDYAALIDSLAGTLDLRGGLAEAVDVAGYTAMISHIANVLNLEAGLQSAIVAYHGTGQHLALSAATGVAELPLRAGAGDPAAWDEIVRRYNSVVLATVRSFRLQSADADDAVQMTWLRLAENCHRIQRPERLGGWLATTARRECLRILRHQAQHSPLTSHDAAEATPRQADSSVDPEQLIIDADIARTLEKLVEELPPSRRTLLRALFSDNPRPYAEAARAAGIPPGGIGPTRARVLRQLRDRLDEQGLTAAAAARKTSGSDSPIVPDVFDPEVPIVPDVLDPEVVVLPLPDVAQRLGLPVTRIHRMLRDGKLLCVRRHGIAMVPAEFLSGREVVKGLPGTITLLRDAGYSNEEIMRWLFTVEDSLSGTPIGALRSDRDREVMHQVKTK